MPRSPERPESAPNGSGRYGKMEQEVKMLHDGETRPHRSAFDVLLPEDCKVFACFEDDGKQGDEMMLMILEAA